MDKATKMIVETKALEFLQKNKSTLPNLYIPVNSSTNENEIMTQ